MTVNVQVKEGERIFFVWIPASVSVAQHLYVISTEVPPRSIRGGTKRRNLKLFEIPRLLHSVFALNDKKDSSATSTSAGMTKYKLKMIKGFIKYELNNNKITERLVCLQPIYYIAAIVTIAVIYLKNWKGV